MHSIPTQIAHVRNRIAASAASVHRRAEDIRLVAVSKARSAAEIEAAYDAGITDFGENYLQEALPKIAALSARAITWHFIGAIQSNKTRDIATHFQWVHTVDRLKIARRLSDQRPADGDAVAHRGAVDVRGHQLGEVGVEREHRGTGVVDDGADLARGERRVQGDRAEPGLLGGELPHQDVEPIGQGVGDDVAGRDAEGPQPVHELVGSPGQLGEGHLLARRRQDDGGAIGMVLGDPPDAEAAHQTSSRFSMVRSPGG